MTIPENVRYFRTEVLKLKQDEIAEKLGVSKNLISLYETGKSTPSIEMLIKIHKVLGITPNEIILGPDTNYSNKGVFVDLDGLQSKHEKAILRLEKYIDMLTEQSERMENENKNLTTRIEKLMKLSGKN